MSTQLLTDTEFLIENVLDHIPVGVLLVDTSSTIVFANELALSILDLEESEVKGKSYLDTYWNQVDFQGKPLDPSAQPLTSAIEKREKTKNFIQGVTQQDRLLWISVDASPVFSRDGELIGGISCFADITEKIELEKKYETEATRNKHLVESVQAVFWEWSVLEDRMTYVSPKVQKMLGYTVEERSKKGFWESKLHPEDKELTISFHRSQMAQGSSHEFEYRFERSDGTYIWIRDIIDVIVEDKKAVFLRGLMIDISEQKKIADELKKKEGLYKLLAENARDLITLRNPDFTYRFVSPSVEENLGYSEEELTNSSLEELFHPQDLKSMIEAYKKALNGASTHIKYRFKHRNGSHYWFEGVIDPVYDGEEIIYIKNTSRQIHGQKMAEDQLAESEGRSRSLITEAPFSISIHMLDGTMINANPAFEKIWDMKMDQFLGKFNILKEPRFQAAKIQSALEHAFNGEKGEIIIHFETVKKRQKDLQVNYFPLLDAEKKVSNVVFISEDITARLEAERKAKTGEALKQGILNSLEDAILVVDKKGKIISVNKRLQTYLQRSVYKNAKVGSDVFSFVKYFDNKELIKSGLEKVLDRSASFFDYETKLADGKWYNLKVTQLKNPYGAVISWQNINTRKEIEIALEKSLKKYRNIYNKAPVMMHSINADAEIMSVSDFWLEKMGYERKEVIGKKSTDFITEDTKKEAERRLKEFFKKGQLRNVPYKLKTKKGETLDVLLSASSEYDEEGNFERSLAGMVDVTELRKTERELVKNRQNLIEAQRISKIGNYELNLEEGVLIPSPELITMVGLRQNQQDLNELLEDLIYPQDLSELVQKLNLSMKNGDDFFHVFRVFHLRNKKLRWVSARGKVLQDERGKNHKMIGTVQDISEQKVAEDKIRRLSDRILLATELAEIGVWEHSMDTREVYWDKQMYEIFEGVAKPILGFKGLAKFVVPEDHEQLWETVNNIKSGARFVELDLRIRVRDKTKYIRTYTRIIRDANANVSRVLGVLYDNTLDKERQLQLEDSLEEKNVLLKEVHHRVKNNMQLVSSILALKSFELKDEDSREVFSEINERIKSMAVIHDQLYKFYNVSEINVADYLNHIARELRVLLGSGKASIVVDADDKLFDVDKALLFGLIVSELVSNAFKHGFAKSDRGREVKIIFKEEGDTNYLAVLNDGEEVPGDILDRKAAGLGVSLIKTFTKQLNGDISLSKKNGFEIRF